MKRRKFIATSVTGIGITALAGCSETEPEETPTDTDDTEPEDIESPYELEFTPDSSDAEFIEPLEYSLELLNATEYPDEPFKIEVTLTNTGEDAIVYGDVNRAFLDGTVDYPYTLINTESEVDFEYDSATQQWFTTEEYTRFSPEIETNTLAPGESHSETVVLAYNRQAHERELQTTSNPFDYEFSTLIYFGLEEEYNSTEDLQLRTFSFRLSIHEL